MCVGWPREEEDGSFMGKHMISVQIVLWFYRSVYCKSVRTRGIYKRKVVLYINRPKDMCDDDDL